MSEQLPQAGWYLNAEGRTQWWDGAAWGRLAPEAPAAPAVPAAAETAEPETAEPEPAEPETAEPEPAAAPAAAEPAPARVAQEFSHEFLEREYGSDRLTETRSELSDPIAQWAKPSGPAAPMAPPVPTAPVPSAAPGSTAANQAAAPAALAAPVSSASFPPPAQSHFPPPPANYPAPGQQPYTTPVSARATVPTHPFAWFALGLGGLALALAIVAGFTNGGWPLTFAYFALVAGIVLSILAILRSTKKALPILALIVCVSGLAWATIVTLVVAIIVAVGNAVPTVTI